MTVKGYKTFDDNLQCRGFQYEVGQTYSLPDGDRPVLCEHGFHFCERAIDVVCWPGTRYAEVEASGDVLREKHKSVCSRIRIVREIPAHEMYALVNKDGTNRGCGNNGRENTGSYNEGNKNSGDLNIGRLNSGNGNVGNVNTGVSNCGSGNAGNYNFGDDNTGSWNSGDKQTGYLNNTPAKIRMFNQETDVPAAEIVFPEFFYRVRLCRFTPKDDMPSEERQLYPNCDKFGGVVQQRSYLRAWRIAFEEARRCDDWPLERRRLLNLPNFDFVVFEQITGISKAEILEPTSRQAMLEDAGIPDAGMAYACAERARNGWSEPGGHDHKLEHAATLLGRTIRDAMYAGCTRLDLTPQGVARPLWHRLFQDLTNIEFHMIVQLLEEKGYKVSYDWSEKRMHIEFVRGDKKC